MASSTGAIFPPWDFDQWNAVDDRVRGGSSTSHLVPVDDTSYCSAKAGPAARFYGHLDIDTLGGAGFASQRYRFGPEPLRLPRVKYQGITLHVRPDAKTSSEKGDRAHTFTLVLKTTLPTRPPSKPRTPPSPDPASLSYEASFIVDTSAASDGTTVSFSFDDFKATYRGREVERHDPRYQPLHPEKIFELSLMCRSGFATQKGDFSVIVESIEGWKAAERRSTVAGIVEVVTTIWAGFVSWVCSFFKGEGKVALPDEEKDRLL